MSPTRARSFRSTTRGKIVQLLLQSPRTVNDLADHLQLTDNAVRSHLVALERDGIIRQSGERKSGGRPAYVYESTERADELFPKAYDGALASLVELLGERLDEKELESLLYEAGSRLAGRFGVDGDPERRLKGVVSLLEEHGSSPELERDGRRVKLSGTCPIVTGVIREHPAAAHLTRGLLDGILGARGRFACEAGEGRPTFRYSVQLPRS